MPNEFPRGGQGGIAGRILRLKSPPYLFSNLIQLLHTSPISSARYADPPTTNASCRRGLDRAGHNAQILP